MGYKIKRQRFKTFQWSVRAGVTRCTRTCSLDAVRPSRTLCFCSTLTIGSGWTRCTGALTWRGAGCEVGKRLDVLVIKVAVLEVPTGNKIKPHRFKTFLWSVRAGVTRCTRASSPGAVRPSRTLCCCSTLTIGSGWTRYTGYLT